MEYSRKVNLTEGPAGSAAGAAAETRVMDFGSVFLLAPIKGEGDDASSVAQSNATGQQTGMNIAELVVSRGFGTVIRHRDFEERSNYYDALLAAESRAVSGKKGIHSAKDPPVMHIQDLTTVRIIAEYFSNHYIAQLRNFLFIPLKSLLQASVKKARDFLPFLQRSRRIPAIVEYVLSGHRFKLLIPKETCSIAFSFSGVRCPGRDEPYSDEAIALMRRKILQRDVEVSCIFKSDNLPIGCSPYFRLIYITFIQIEVETVDRTGTFLGSLWESRTNMAVTLLEAGLAKLQTSFGSDRIPDAHLLEQAERSAKSQKLKVRIRKYRSINACSNMLILLIEILLQVWEKYVEGEEVTNGAAVESKQKEVLKVLWILLHHVLSCAFVLNSG